ncbi:MAG: GNAT family N-acetyltransferase [Tannerellaceae bacterium]|nr:GNAT family N-acetyltransferase [Tannerellaceae bacterium]
MDIQQRIQCKPLNTLDKSVLDQVEQTYTSSFPVNERRDFDLVRKMLEDNPDFKIYAFIRQGIYVGFISAWVFEHFAYIEHFAIDESARNGGIGAGAIKQFMEICQLPVVLEVELPKEDLSKRRIRFYERLGFILNTHPYLQPPYRSGEEWLDMYLMTYGEIDLEKRYEQIKEILYKRVYGII